jgi:trans-2,3-dihydro-3-hydroxyanthranilate isomerase
MRTYAFETVDVFTDRRFAGNPLAVVTDARGLDAATMQAIAAEFNLSETTFVLPAEDAANTARVRIFNPTAEMAFAGHPSIGTAFVLASTGAAPGDVLRLEVPAGIAAVTLECDAVGAVVGGTVEAPQPLGVGAEVAVGVVARCSGLAAEDIIVANHPPVQISTGNPYVLAEVGAAALARAVPDVAAFRAALAAYPAFGARFSLHLYAHLGAGLLKARMFAPLAGTLEDPATGSANAPLAAYLLQLQGGERADFVVHQGEYVGRPSLIRAGAFRSADGIRATVGGRCVPVMRGELHA